MISHSTKQRTHHFKAILGVKEVSDPPATWSTESSLHQSKGSRQSGIATSLKHCRQETGVGHTTNHSA